MKKALYILAGLSDRDFSWLLSVGKKQTIRAGTVLIRQNEPINTLYLLLEGALSVSTDLSAGGEIARLTRGEIVGEVSFLDARSPTATVTAIEDCVVWSIPRPVIAAKILQDVNFAAHFYQALAVFLADRLRSTIGQIGYSREYNSDKALNSEDHQTIELLGSPEIAKIRLDWLMNALKKL